MITSFHVKPSLLLATLMLALYGIGTLIWLQIPLHPEIKLAGMIFHLLHGCISWHYLTHLSHPNAIKLFEYCTSHQWKLQEANGQQWDALLQAPSFCTRHYAILHFKLILTGQHKKIILFPDSLSSEATKQLRRLLRWEL